MTAKSPGCLCRVPLAEVAPSFTRSEELVAWCEVRGLSVEPDYLDRPSISMPDAIRLRDERRASEAEAAELAQVRSAVATADQERARIFEEAFGRAMQQPVFVVPNGFAAGTAPMAAPPNPFRARAEAAAAVAAFDKTLPREVRERLNALPLWPTRAM